MIKRLLVTPEYPEGILLDLTFEEISQREEIYLKTQQDNISEQNKKETDLANKQSAQNKLKALGLNDAEIKSIIG